MKCSFPSASDSFLVLRLVAESDGDKKALGSLITLCDTGEADSPIGSWAGSGEFVDIKVPAKQPITLTDLEALRG